MAGFIWKYQKRPGENGRLRVTLSTFRRQYGEGQDAFWDEEISAFNAKDNQPIKCFREVRDAIEEVIFVGEFAEGEVIKLYKDERLYKYILIAEGDIFLFDSGYQTEIEQYLEGMLSLASLVAEAVDE